MNLVALYFDTGNAGERSFVHLERNDQVVAVDRYALQHLRLCFAVTKIPHERLNCSAVLFQQREARVTAAVTKKRNQTDRSEEHTSELQSRLHLVCRLLLEKKK